jgi:hypothetical protein
VTGIHVKNPILHLEVLAADGTRATSDVVFCQLQRQSMPVEECCGCVHCDVIAARPAPSVECTIPRPLVELPPDHEGHRTAVAGLLCSGTVVVLGGAELGQALDLLRETDRRSIAIVDSRHVLIGLVHETDSLARMGHSRGDAVSATMRFAIAVDECMPVRRALEVLAASHLRDATVVSKRGVPIGVFRDVEGLRWIGAAKQGRLDVLGRRSDDEER